MTTVDVALVDAVGRAAGSATLNASNAASLAGGALLELGVGEGVAGKEGDGESEDAGELHFAGGYRKLRICCLGLWCCLGTLDSEDCGMVCL